jgi:hypothetical protein
LYFRKFIQEIFSELDEMKAKLPIFPDTKTESRADTEEGDGAVLRHPVGNPKRKV